LPKADTADATQNGLANAAKPFVFVELRALAASDEKLSP